MGVPSRSKVSVCKRDGGDNSLVHNPHSMVLFVPLPDATKNGDGFVRCWLIYHNLKSESNQSPRLATARRTRSEE
jgi:hypothetical protein